MMQLDISRAFTYFIITIYVILRDDALLRIFSLLLITLHTAYRRIAAAISPAILFYRRDIFAPPLGFSGQSRHHAARYY